MTSADRKYDEAPHDPSWFDAAEGVCYCPECMEASADALMLEARLVELAKSDRAAAEYGWAD